MDLPMDQWVDEWTVCFLFINCALKCVGCLCNPPVIPTVKFAAREEKRMFRAVGVTLDTVK